MIPSGHGGDHRDAGSAPAALGQGASSLASVQAAVNTRPVLRLEPLRANRATSPADDANAHVLPDILPCMGPFVTWFSDKTLPSARSWRGSPQRVKVPVEHEQSYRNARKRIVEAVSSVLGPAANFAHEALFVGVDLLQFAPVPALDVAGQVLLNIWDAVEMIENNRLACLRLAERCAELLIAIREEIGLANVDVADELKDPVARLHTAFEEISECLQRQVRRPFWIRYVKREEIQRNIGYCDTLLHDARDLFSIRIQIRTLRLAQATEARYQQGEGTSTAPVSGEHPVTNVPTLSRDIDELQNLKEVHRALDSYRNSQNSIDSARDRADLRQLLHGALQTEDDVTMMKVLQVGCDEMPQAIRALQRALEQETRNRQLSTSKRSPPPQSPGQVDAQGDTHAVEREFIRTSIKVLKRLSSVAGVSVPTWATTSSVEIGMQTPLTPMQSFDTSRVRSLAPPVPESSPTTSTQSGSDGDDQPSWSTRQVGSGVGSKGFEMSLEDPVWQVLLAAELRRYKVKDCWQNYAMFICYGPPVMDEPDDRIERCLSFDEKPLPIFRELKRTSKQPVIKLKHLKDLRSPVTIAQQKYAARKVTRTASSTFTLNYHPNLNSEPSRLVLYAIASVSNTSPNVESPRQIISSGSGENHRGNERKVPVSRQDLGFCVAIYPYMARQMDEFDVVVGGTFVIISRAPGWWHVQRDPQGTGAVDGDPSKQGWIPTGCLLETRIPIAYAATSTSTNSLNFSSTTQSSSINYTSRRIDAYTPILPQCFVTASVPCYAIVEYKKRNAEEVDLSKDETLRVFKRYKHWTYVVKDDGQRGWVPSWYIGKSAVLVQLPDGISSPGGVSGSGGEDDASPTLDSTIGALPLRRAMDERECVGGVTAYMDVCTMMEFPPRRKGIGMSAHRQRLCRLCATCVESPEHALLICTSSEALVATRVSFLLQLSLLWPGFKPPVDDDDAPNALRALVEEKEVRGVLGTFAQEVFLIFDAV